MSPDDINLAVGNRIALRRRELRLSLAQIAGRCGVSLQQIHKYETGQSNISIVMLTLLAECLDVPVGYFVDAIEQGARRTGSRSPASPG